MNKRIYLKINSDLTAFTEVLLWFDQINQPPIFNKQIWWQCQTLLVESFTNIVEHAHKDLSAETPIEIEVLRTNNYIEIRLWSQGKAFDLERQLQETSELENNDQGRGRGLRIMAAIADHLSYEPTIDNRYCLFIRKSY
ncbi:ATPase [Hapalosiphon sp. MRB220]|nr:ATPase [Hapalosiphon sp. MRB220]